MASGQMPKQRAFPEAQIRPGAAVQAQAPKVQQAVARQRAELALPPEAGQQRAWPQPEARAQGVQVARQPLPSFE